MQHSVALYSIMQMYYFVLIVQSCGLQFSG